MTENISKVSIKMQPMGAIKLSPEQIELINSYGPYNHSVWSSGNINVSNEERLSGRGEFLAECIKDCLLKHFTIEEIKTFSILDVGCYDGWILHTLSELPFKQLTGIEPRERNIEKGRKIREILGIHSRVEFKVGDIENIGSEKFDIVICTGLLHHVESIPHAIRNLRNACKKFLFIETICLPSRHITDSLKYDMELKDIVYKNKSKDCGITAQKYESSYYDGSAKEYAVVSVPSGESIRMYMNINGFNVIQIVPDAHYDEKILKRSGRPVNAVCLYGLITSTEPSASLNQEDIVLQYESGLINTTLDPEYFYPVYSKFFNKKNPAFIPLKSFMILLYLKSSGFQSEIGKHFINRWIKNEFELEIIMNIKFNPIDKLRYEYAKILINNGETEKAIGELTLITQKINADWRACYRAFYSLSKIFKRKGNQISYQKYMSLCQTCNPNFPKKMFENE